MTCYPLKGSQIVYAVEAVSAGRPQQESRLLNSVGGEQQAWFKTLTQIVEQSALLPFLPSASAFPSSFQCLPTQENFQKKKKQFYWLLKVSLYFLNSPFTKPASSITSQIFKNFQGSLTDCFFLKKAKKPECIYAYISRHNEQKKKSKNSTNLSHMHSQIYQPIKSKVQTNSLVTVMDPLFAPTHNCMIQFSNFIFMEHQLSYLNDMPSAN